MRCAPLFSGPLQFTIRHANSNRAFWWVFFLNKTEYSLLLDYKINKTKAVHDPFKLIYYISQCAPKQWQHLHLEDMSSFAGLKKHHSHLLQPPSPADLRQLRKFNLPQALLKQFYSAIIESVLSTPITVWFSSATKSDLRRLRKVVRTAERIIGTSLPTLQELYSSRVSKRAGKITLDPHIQHTPSLNCYRLVNATEFWVPERPDAETVSFCKQSVSWTLDIKRGTHNTIIHYLFITHTYFILF